MRGNSNALNDIKIAITSSNTIKYIKTTHILYILRIIIFDGNKLLENRNKALSFLLFFSTREQSLLL